MNRVRSRVNECATSRALHFGRRHQFACYFVGEFIGKGRDLIMPSWNSIGLLFLVSFYNFFFFFFFLVNNVIVIEPIGNGHGFVTCVFFGVGRFYSLC